LVAVQADTETQARYDDLAGKRNGGLITPEELAELDAMVRANSFLGILKTQARWRLDSSTD
jgi:hypothetical protein